MMACAFFASRTPSPLLARAAAILIRASELARPENPAPQWFYNLLAGAPRVLVYGHYDVQPPDPLSEWISPPFEPTLRNASIYARGSADNKGQFFCHLKAVETILQNAGLTLSKRPSRLLMTIPLGA